MKERSYSHRASRVAALKRQPALHCQYKTTAILLCVYTWYVDSIYFKACRCCFKKLLANPLLQLFSNGLLLNLCFPSHHHSTTRISCIELSFKYKSSALNQDILLYLCNRNTFSLLHLQTFGAKEGCFPSDFWCSMESVQIKWSLLRSWKDPELSPRQDVLSMAILWKTWTMGVTLFTPRQMKGHSKVTFSRMQLYR